MKDLNKVNENCILLKRNEYDKLVEKANSCKPNEIIINWNWYKGYGYVGGFDANLNVSGNVELSNKIFRQLRNICNIIKLEYDTKIVENYNTIKKNAKIDVLENFSSLPWYKRLFFNEKYIK